MIERFNRGRASPDVTVVDARGGMFRESLGEIGGRLAEIDGGFEQGINVGSPFVCFLTGIV